MNQRECKQFYWTDEYSDKHGNKGKGRREDNVEENIEYRFADCDFICMRIRVCSNNRRKECSLSAANNYLSFTAFSKTGLFDQLKFEGYTDSEAKYAVENCGADWKEQAVKAAQSYYQSGA